MIRKTFDELKLTGKLPSPSGVGMKILQLTRGDEYSAEDIGRTIMADSALTGRLLRIANSAQIAPHEPIATVSEATMRLGLRTVRNVALGLSLLSTHRTGACQQFDYDRYWTSSIARAIAAQHLARSTGLALPAEAYVLGLIAEIGYLALATVYPEKYSTLIVTCGARDPHDLARMEHEVFDIDHAEIGALMVEEWGLPRPYGQALQLYERPGRLPHETAADVDGFVSILRVAHVLAEIFTTPFDGSDAATRLRYAAQLERMRGMLGLGAGEYYALCNTIAREWTECGNVLNVPTLHVPDLSTLGAQTAGAARDGRADADLPELAPAGADERFSEAGGHGSGEVLRILAVDDDPMSLKLLERHLSKAGHQVICARDGRAALQIALETNPQVVIADWMMPELDGIELCKALRRIESGRDMFFLLLTGRGEEDRVVEAFDAGVDDYVVKPFNPKLLMARLKGGQRVIELKEKVENDRQIMLKQVAELGLLTRKLRTAALTDVLTELPNRRYVIKRLEQEWETSRRTGRPLSLIMIDIDHFKKINDVHGHDIGDLVLKETANVLRAQTRTSEEPARLGGEEFLVVCSNTNADQAQVCAERIRVAVHGNTIRTLGFEGSVTVSLGIAEMQPDMPGIDALLKASDDAVYQAKGSGRNKVWRSSSARAQTKSA